LKIAHVGDTHLGKKALKLKEREKDFELAFERFIDSVIENKVDMVIHSGDLFDTGKPDIEVILFCMKQLARLKEKGIPFFVVKGSHDVGFGDTKTIIDLLEQAGLLVDLSNPRYLHGNELLGERVGNVCIYGVWGKKSKIKEFYQNINVKLDPNCFNILLFHHAVSSIAGSEMFADINTEDLPKGFDYYASGHWHGREELKYNGKPLIYPGSLENCNMDEMIRNDEKGYYLIDTETGEYKFVRIKTRPVIVLEVEANDEDADTLMDKAINSIKEVKSKEGEEPILIILFYGKIKDKRSKIDKGYLSRVAKEKGYLFANVSISRLKEEEDNQDIEIKQTNVKDIEKEYLGAKGYSESEVELAQKIMEILGAKLKPSELEKEVEKVKKLIEAYAK